MNAAEKARLDQLVDAAIEEIIGAIAAGENEIEFSSPVVYDWCRGDKVTLGNVVQALARRCLHSSPSLLLATPANDLVGCSYCGKSVISRSEPGWVEKARQHAATCEKHPMFAMRKSLGELIRFFESARPGGRVLESDPDIGAARSAFAGGAA